MKKFNLFRKPRGGGNLKLLPQGFWGYTLAEVIIVMLIIAVIVSVTIGITKAKLDNVISYTYYNAYSTLREITRKMLADWDPTDPEYKQQALNSNNELLSQTKLAIHDSFINSVLEFPNDRRFFSTLISHIPFSIKISSDKVKAGNQVTIYGCPTNSTMNYGGLPSELPASRYGYFYVVDKKMCATSGGVNGFIVDDNHIKCPGKYKGTVDTFASTSSTDTYFWCYLDCSDLNNVNGKQSTANCGSTTNLYDITCGAASFNNSVDTIRFNGKKAVPSHVLTYAKLISSTLLPGNVCKSVIECKEGYEWKSYGTNLLGYPYGNCVKNAGGGACNKSCYGSGQKLDKDACECYVDCWDGSRKEYSYQCPSKVTCWDGSYAHSQSECPACTNKPSTIACGYKWDETKCKLTGYEKKCYGTGQVIDPSTCECYAPCWDGSREEYSWQCPSKVTCWDGSYAHNKSECPACTNKPATIPCGQSWDDEDCKITGTKKTCSSYSAPNLNPTTCECYANCWDGTTANYSWNCPYKYTCWDGSFVHNSSECPPCTKTCSSGYYLESSSCTCKKIQVTCWDGSKADTYAECPSYVTCWDGSKKYNYSQCPACPNKPRCPAGNWSDITCTGDSKMCPAGQHLNSGCSCVNDCPSAAELTPCRLCSDETGEITKNPDINRTCSDETYEWSEEQCKCIISPRTLPRQGANFCKLFEANANIMGNTDVCQGSEIASNTTDFSDKKPDVTLRNGLRIYNMHNDATAIAMLEGNTQGGVYDGVPNTNAYGYTVYIDIDGVKGDSRLWSDVYPFYITLSGKVIPGYDSSANPNGAGGDSTSHMQVSVEYEHFNSGKRAISWLAKSVPFKDGACIAGYVGDATPYCRNNPAVTKAPNCSADLDSVCRVKQIQPVKFFF